MTTPHSLGCGRAGAASDAQTPAATWGPLLGLWPLLTLSCRPVPGPGPLAGLVHLLILPEQCGHPPPSLASVKWGHHGDRPPTWTGFSTFEGRAPSKPGWVGGSRCSSRDGRPRLLPHLVSRSGWWVRPSHTALRPPGPPGSLSTSPHPEQQACSRASSSSRTEAPPAANSTIPQALSRSCSFSREFTATAGRSGQSVMLQYLSTPGFPWF